MQFSNFLLDLYPDSTVKYLMNIVHDSFTIYAVQIQIVVCFVIHCIIIYNVLQNRISLNSSSLANKRQMSIIWKQNYFIWLEYIAFYIPKTIKKIVLIHYINVKEDIVNCDRERWKRSNIFQNRIWIYSLFLSVYKLERSFI